MNKRTGCWTGAVATAGLIVVALAGCGTLPASSAGAHHSTPGTRQPGSGKVKVALCMEPSAAAQVRVSQQTTFTTRSTQVASQQGGSQQGGSQQGAPGPSAVVIGMKARSLARAVCALPPMPSGPLSCPVLLPGAYRLVFIAAGHVLPAVMVQATGCREVTGLGHVRWAIHSQALLEELARIATGTQ